MYAVYRHNLYLLIDHNSFSFFKYMTAALIFPLQDNHFDFNYQEYRNLASEVTVLPGDELIMECIYESVGNHTFIYVWNLALHIT